LPPSYFTLIVKVAAFEDEPAVAVTLAVVWLVTADVDTANVVDVLPLGTTAVDGTVAEPFELASVIDKPPEGAAEPIVTVPVEVLPPTTEAGLRVRPVIAGGLIVSFALWLAPLRLAVTVATVWADTAVVFTGKVV